jgi:hypothetical protein
MSVAYENAPLLGGQNSDNVTFQAGRRVWPDPLGNFHAMGCLYTTTAGSALATGTSEQTLGTYTIPAYTLDLAGRKLRIRTSWSTAANTHGKIMKLYFGSTSISTGSVTTASAFPMLELNVTLADTEDRARIWGWGFGGTDGVTLVRSTAVLLTSFSTAIEIKATGQTDTSAASDITLFDFAIEYMN